MWRTNLLAQIYAALVLLYAAFCVAWLFGQRRASRLSVSFRVLRWQGWSMLLMAIGFAVSNAVALVTRAASRLAAGVALVAAVTAACAVLMVLAGSRRRAGEHSERAQAALGLRDPRFLFAIALLVLGDASLLIGVLGAAGRLGSVAWVAGPTMLVASVAVASLRRGRAPSGERPLGA